jgi:LmbE family N-acetylglucosaminyl deacetylase
MKKHISIFIFTAALFWCISYISLAAGSPAANGNSAEILQDLNRLNVLGSVLYIAAHPDDENTRLMSYLVGERKVRTAYLSITRGDGGQNLIGKEQGEMLGLIRTHELLAARKIDGAEQFFTRANDFGYSKNPGETFGFWNKDSVLSDVVWVIRMFKPDVIIMRFPTTGEGGHGHHTASAILAVEAFDAAADPNMFPEQLLYVSTWKAKRLFWNTFNFGTNNTTSPDQLQIDCGVFNPLLGRSYGEISAMSRSMHKSQGFGSALYRGSQLEYFKLIKGEPYTNDLFEGVDMSWGRVSGSEEVKASIDKIISSFDMYSPGSSVPLLLQLDKKLHSLDIDDPASYWRQKKINEVKDLILECAGIWLEADASDYSAVPGGSIGLTLEVICRNLEGVRLKRIAFSGSADTTADLLLEKNISYKLSHAEKIDKIAEYTNPYWLNSKHSPGLYTANDRMLIGSPESNPGSIVGFSLEIEGSIISVIRPVVYKSTDPVKGEIYRPLEILPMVTINPEEKVYVFTSGIPKKVRFRVEANTPGISGTVEAKITPGWKIDIKNPSFSINEKSGEYIVDAEITPGKNAISGMLELSVIVAGEKFTKSIRRIEYDHIPHRFVLSDAEVKLVSVDLNTGGVKRVGYIPGAGDDVAASLSQAGYTVTMLSDEYLTSGDLTKFNAIVSGVRAYNTNERLQVHYQRLMDYVNKGGNLIVQYNTNNRIGPIVAKMGPYNFNISRERVTNENAEVRFLKPEHRVLNEPNKITAADFEGWVQERGIYFANELDAKLEAVLSMNDPGEEPKDGSLIIAKYGKGHFFYTGLVFFRELPAGVTGAYRLFANLLAL